MAHYQMNAGCSIAVWRIIASDGRRAASAGSVNGAYVCVFVVAILGNAAEYATAITAALKDRMDLSLSIAIGSSVLVTGQVAGDGRSDWLKGAQLLAVYLILGLTYFFMPDASSH
jgi:Ca2+:H+ antiporter